MFRELVLFIKLFVAIMIEISKNTLKRDIESDIAFRKVLGASPNLFYNLKAVDTH